MKYNDLLIIFVDNSKIEDSKNKLATELGDKAAIEIQNKIIEYTYNVVSKALFVDIAVYYSQEPNNNDIWEEMKCKKFEQKGNTISQSIKHAFYDSFNYGYKRIVAIGSQSLEINHAIIDKAFDILYTGKTVLGPASNGDLYLVGLNYPFPQFFNHNNWGKKHLFQYTKRLLEELDIEFSILEKKTIVKSLEDIEPHYEKLATINNLKESVL